MPALILTHWKALLITVLAVLCLVFYNQKQAADVRAEGYKTKMEQMGASVIRQNRMTEEWKKAAEERAKEYEEKIAAAQAARDKAQSKAGAIISRPQPDGLDACKAAEQLFNEEIGNAHLSHY